MASIPDKPSLSIILPCYNPVIGWEEHIVSACSLISRKLGFDPEVVVVNDGSKFPLPEAEVRYLKDRVPHIIFKGYRDNLGKGAALRLGVAGASGEMIIFTDIDFPYQIESLLAIWQQLRKNDVVIGIKDEGYYQHVPLFRIWISKILRKLIGFLFRMPITDTQCGLKGFNQKGKSVFLSTTINRYLCDLEFVYLCFQQKPRLKIAAQAVSLRPEVEFSKMNFKILLKESINFLSIILKRRKN